MPDSPHIASRMQDINAFEVMKLLARARELEAAGRTIIHMEIGEPDFVSPEPVIQAGQAALASGLTHYTAALGLPALREAISEHYRRHHAVNVSANRIIITPGASGALQLVCGVLLNPGDQVLMADPGYPCNRNFVRLVEAQAISVPVTAETAYQLTPQLIEAYWQPDTVAVMAASPSNPTGTILEHGVMQTIHEIVGEKHGALIVDEIYHGLVYGNKLHTACEIADDIFVINSFSKYFGMTGWRIGWLVVPEAYVEPVDRLAQNIFLAASTPAQYAALAALDPQTESILHARRDEYARRRDYLIPALQQLGFDIPVKPEGAFYIYANCERFTSDSYAFADELLEKAGVAITPGMDFGTNQAAQHVRFAYTTSLENLKEGVRRLQEFL